MGLYDLCRNICDVVLIEKFCKPFLDLDGCDFDSTEEYIALETTSVFTSLLLPRKGTSQSKNTYDVNFYQPFSYAEYASTLDCTVEIE